MSLHLKILLVTNLFSPDELAGAALFSDLALFLKETCADIRVTTTFSYYPAWKTNHEDGRNPFRYDHWYDIPIKRIKMYVPIKPTGFSRILSDMSFLGALLRYGRHNAWVPDVIITASPMFSQCLAQRFLYRGRKIPRMIIVQDFVVDAALDLGILRLGGLKRFLRKLERWSFRSAQILTTISQPMLEKLSSIVGHDRRIVLIPNWIHKSLQEEIDRQSSKEPLREEMTLFYSGNLGVKQGLPSFLQDFSMVKSAWALKIHGGGAQSRAVKATAKEIPGVRIGDVLSESAYVNELLTCTACLVTQTSRVGANFLPSKILPALATGTPVLAICEPTSPLGQEVQQGGFGVVISPQDTKALYKTLDSWKKNPRLLSDLGAKALVRAKRYHRDQVLPLYLSEISLLKAQVITR